jgi:TadE-like protein
MVRDFRKRNHNMICKFFPRLKLRGGPCSRRIHELAGAELGAEIFEFALVAPLLLMLLIGIFWIGRAYNVYSTITRAAREGARYAVLPSSVAAGNVPPDALSASCSTNTNTYNNFIVPALTADGLDPQNVKSYCQKAVFLQNTYPQQCGVSISFLYRVQLAIPFTSLNATTINIPANAQMRLENQPTATGGGCS